MSESHHDGPLGLREMKRNAARAALDFIEPGALIGVGSGTTVWCFIEVLAESGLEVGGAVAASVETARRLAESGVQVLELNGLRPSVYIDGADEVDMSGRALKGGGAAHTREKQLAFACLYWACIVDASKVVRSLSDIGVPIEVAPDMVDEVSASIAALGGRATLREGTLTDAGNPVLVALGLALDDPLRMEETLDGLPGVIGNGIFAKRPADVIIVGRATGGVGRIVPHRDSSEL